MPNSILFFARVILGMLGITVMGVGMTAEWLGVDPNPGWGSSRRLLFALGLGLLLASTALQSMRFRRWMLKGLGFRMLSTTQIALILLIRVIIGSIGLALVGFWLVSPTIPKPVRASLLPVGLCLLVATFLLQHPALQRWFVTRVGLHFWSSAMTAALIFIRLILSISGIVVTILVVAADWLGLDPTPGWGIARKLQLVAGLTLLGGSYLLQSRTLQARMIRSFGWHVIISARSIISWLTRGLLVITGLVTTFMVIAADWLGLDPTPGWGMTRTLQLLAGLSILASSLVVHNKSLKGWFQKEMGLKVLSPGQILIVLLTRLMLCLTGVVIVVLVFCADWLGLDPTPGWSEARVIQLIAGLALLFAGFSAGSVSLLRWQLRRLF